MSPSPNQGPQIAPYEAVNHTTRHIVQAARKQIFWSKYHRATLVDFYLLCNLCWEHYELTSIAEEIFNVFSQRES